MKAENPKQKSDNHHQVNIKRFNAQWQTTQVLKIGFDLHFWIDRIKNHAKSSTSEKMRYFHILSKKIKNKT